MPGRTTVTAALALLLTVAACDRAPAPSPSTLDVPILEGLDPQDRGLEAEQPEDQKSPAPSPDLAALDGLVVFLDEGGNVALVAPDGSGRHQLTSDADSDLVYQQPTWGPAGQQVAWSRFEPGQSSGVVEIADADGSVRLAIETSIVPFYLFWDPTGSSIAMLGSGAETIELWVASAGSGSLRRLLAGEPFYFSWSPDGRRMLVHLDNMDLRLLALDGPVSSLSGNSQGYQAPQWGATGRLVYAVGGTDGLSASLAPVAAQSASSELIVTLPDGTGTAASIPFEGVAAFSLSADGRRLAYSVTEVAVRAQVGANFGPLHVVDVASEEAEEVTTEPVVLFQWSPDGEKVLYASVEGDGAALRWHVWAEGEVRAYGSFRPTGLFTRAYLPFWDQYAQSMRLWSPGSDAFVYTAESGTGGEVVVQLLADQTPRVVASGEFAAWSP